MALTLLQAPATSSLSQSPMVFAVSSSLDLANPGFQYVCNLYIWSGSVATSGSYAYQLVKYPNSSETGIFEFGRIVNSTMTDLVESNPSNVKWVKGQFFYRYQLYSNGPYTNITSSMIESNVYQALDGYGIFQEPIGQPLYLKTPHWPLMTDGPVTQSVLVDDIGTSGVYVADIGYSIPDRVKYTSNLGVTADILVSAGSGTSTFQLIKQYPVAPGDPLFPISTIGLEWYTIQAYYATTPIGTPIKYNIVCNQKYPNVRIKWKNRYGQFDFIDCNMISRESFQTEKRTYQPQIGSWDSRILEYQEYDTSVQNYVTDSKQGLSVNTNWMPENWNEVLKQLLVSDEIYWIYNQSNNNVRPLTIRTSNVTFKTGVVDKLIQYQLDFDYGQAYKLIL